MRQNKIYLIVMGAVLLAFTVIFDFFPRSVYSPLEKRELAKFPHFTVDSLFSGQFTSQVSSWFSDSEPFRDIFMSMSMEEKDLLRLPLGEDDITFHASTDAAGEEGPTDEELEQSERQAGEYENTLTADEETKIANRGILIIGKGSNTRALMLFGGGAKSGYAYAEAANKYKETFGDGVNVYCMAIPTPVAYYCPDKVKNRTNDERVAINNLYAHLNPDVHAVDVYTPLGQHASEAIFLRTDHHWTPLGAYYAAQRFAQVAKVPFKTLQSYDKHVIHGYVGSMYGYSRDINLERNPEDFVYYTPKGITYTTTYTDYHSRGATGKPFQGPYFYHFKDGSKAAYSSFMGGDMSLTVVRTHVNNHRRVLIIKDSFGNALPGYLFFSFEEVHVIDFRYFPLNLKAYVERNKITDVLLANNVFNACSPKISRRYVALLSQRDNTSVAKHQEAKPKAKTEPKAEPKPEPAHQPKATHEPAHPQKGKPEEKPRPQAEPSKPVPEAHHAESPAAAPAGE